MTSELDRQADALLNDPDALVMMSEDVMDQKGNVQLESAAEFEDLTSYHQCPGCYFPHLSEQQAFNCCPPKQVWCCPQCGGFTDSPQEARDCCR